MAVCLIQATHEASATSGREHEAVGVRFSPEFLHWDVSRGRGGGAGGMPVGYAFDGVFVGRNCLLLTSSDDIIRTHELPI
jgi:hypothetical protein